MTINPDFTETPFETHKTGPVNRTLRRTLGELGVANLDPAPARTPRELAMDEVRWIPDGVPYGRRLNALVCGLVRVADVLPDNGHDSFPGGYHETRETGEPE